MYEFASVVCEDEIAIVTMNRPDRRNALHPAAHHEMETIFDNLALQPGLRCLILTGAGEAFCAGYDLRDNLETGVLEIAVKGFAGLTSRIDYPLPIIAAVNGVAIGGGFETALACDIIVASHNAHFSMPEARVGWSPLGGGLQRLPRIVGEKRALDIVLSGRHLGAEEAERIGIVSEVTAPDELMPVARRWAKTIASGAPLSIACNREVVRCSLDMPLAQALDISNFPSAARVLESEDAVEGKRAFVEKRPPRWQGR